MTPEELKKQKRFFSLVILIPILIGLLWLIVGAFSIILSASAYPFADNFETYELGNIVGQGGWQHLDSSGTYNVVDTIVRNGTKSVQAITGRVDKLGSYVPTGEWIFYIYKADGATNPFSILLQGDWEVWDIGCGMVSIDKYPVSEEDEVCLYNMTGGFNQICFGETIRNEWFKLTIQWDFTSMLYRAKVNSGEYSDWAAIYNECSAVGFRGVRFSTGSNATYVDDIGEEVGKIYTIAPASGTEITDLSTAFEFGWEGLEDWDNISVVFQNRPTGIFSEAQEYIIETTSPSGSMALTFEDFGFDRNGVFYFYGVATKLGIEFIEDMYITGRYSYQWSEDLVDPESWFTINIEGLQDIFGMSDFEEWYVSISKFTTPTDMFVSIVGFFDPIFGKIGEFGNRIKDYFNLSEVYSQGYEIGKTIPYFTFFVAQVSMFFGGFPILKWLGVIILILIGVFIFRLILKFIPFLGGS